MPHKNLYAAAEAGDITAVYQFIANGADVNQYQQDGIDKGISPLFAAACHGSLDVMEALIANGSDINLQQNCRLYKGMSPIHVAVCCGEINAVKLLLKHDANINQGNNHLNPISIAKAKGHTEIVNVLQNHIENQPSRLKRLMFYFRSKTISVDNNQSTVKASNSIN